MVRCDRDTQPGQRQRTRGLHAGRRRCVLKGCAGEDDVVALLFTVPDPARRMHARAAAARSSATTPPCPARPTQLATELSLQRQRGAGGGWSAVVDHLCGQRQALQRQGRGGHGRHGGRGHAADRLED